MSASILVVEDRDALRRLLERALDGAGYEVVSADRVEDAERALDERAFDFVLTDLRLPDGDGLEVVRRARRVDAEVPVVVLTAYGNVQSAVDAMKAGAADFLEKPVEIDDLLALLASHLDREAPSSAVALAVDGAAPIIGRHPRLRAAIRLLRKVASTETTVLLLGESGTGKELFAQSLHALSDRRNSPFVALNCAAIPTSLVENELFGHEKGAFTGAGSRHRGRFEQAEGGTLLLDEIGELELGVQAKILRVIEERTFQRIGSDVPRSADVRLVAATNRDLEAAVAAGEFRRDLYYRLDVFPIHLPPLRERATDAPELARHLLAVVAEREGVRAPQLSEDAEEFLRAEPWPGNVRQLANVLERALIVCDSGTLTAADLDSLIETRHWRDADSSEASANDERARVRGALLASDGDKKAAAEALGVSYRTLLRRVREYDLEGFPKYRD